MQRAGHDWTKGLEGRTNAACTKRSGQKVMLAKEFEEIRFTHLEREGNHFADDLATLAAMTTIDLKYKVQPVHIDIRNDPAHCCLVEGEIDGKPWYYDIKNLVQNHIRWELLKRIRKP